MAKRSRTVFKKGNKAAKGKGPNQQPTAPARGRPPNEVVIALREYLTSHKREDLDGKTCREMAIEVLVQHLKRGDKHVAELILSRTDPEAAENQHTGVIQIEHIYPNEQRAREDLDPDDDGFDPD